MLMPKLLTGLLTVSIWHRRSALVTLLVVKKQCWCLEERSQTSALCHQKGALFEAHLAHSHLTSCKVLFGSWLWSPWGWRSEKRPCSAACLSTSYNRPILNFHRMQKNERKHKTESEGDLHITEQPQEEHTKKSHYIFFHASANLE